MLVLVELIMSIFSFVGPPPATTNLRPPLARPDEMWVYVITSSHLKIVVIYVKFVLCFLWCMFDCSEQIKGFTLPV